MMGAHEYQAQLLSLLPQGLPWPREPDTVLGRLLGAWAHELARVDARGADLLEESDPAAALALLGEWERAYGLPGACAAEEALIEARRAVLVGQITAQRAQTPAYFAALAAAFGVSARVVEYRAHTVEDDVEAPLQALEWAHAWALVSPALGAVVDRSVEDGVEMPLAAWPTNAVLECVIRRLSPAGTVVLFIYEEV